MTFHTASHRCLPGPLDVVGRVLCTPSLLDEKLLKTIPLVNEANAYADEMGMAVSFTVKLMSNPGKKAHWASRKTEDGEAEEGEVFVLDTEVCACACECELCVCMCM